MPRWGDEKTFKFVRLYRDNECLWNVFSPLHKDKAAKERAYENIIHMMQDEHLNVDAVKAKIKSLRSVYCAEMKKMKDPTRLSADGGPYKPSLWWFDTMHDFLGDNVEIEVMDSTSDTIFADNETVELNGQLMSQPTSISTISSLGKISKIQSLSTKRQFLPIRNETIVKKLLPEKRTRYPSKDDSFSIFGKHVAFKLRTLSSQQNIFAQKLINDVLFEAEMGILSKDYRIERQPIE